MVNQNIDNRVQEFTRTDKGFVCKTDYESEECVYFTVPYEKGWKAYIDGEVTGLIESGAMMLIKVPAGKHGIEFVHETEGFKIGIFISCVSLFVVSFYAVIFWRLRGRKKNGI